MSSARLEPLPITPEEVDDLLFPSRYGDVEDLSSALDALAEKYGAEEQARQRILLAAKNEGGNTPWHYSAANGHEGTFSLRASDLGLRDLGTLTSCHGLDVIAYLAPFTPAQMLIYQNEAGNTPLHWAALNGHLAVVKRLVDLIETEESTAQLAQLDVQAHLEQREEEDPDAPAPPAWDIRNATGRGPMTEAERNGKEDVVQFLLERSIVGSNQKGVQDGPSADGADGEAEDDEVPDKDYEQEIPPAA